MPKSDPTPDPAADLPAADPDLSFEDAFGRLEGLVREMESDDMPLTVLIEAYERGIQLHALCQKRLDEARGRVEMIRKQNSGAIEVAPFDENEAADAPESDTASSSPSLKDDAELF